MKAYVFYSTYHHWVQSLLDANYTIIGCYQPDVTIDPDKYMEQDRLSNLVLQMNFPKIQVMGPMCIKEHFNDIDLIVGSPPCVGFSKASPVSRLDHPWNKHTLNFAKWIAKILPEHFLMEMVPELLTKGEELWVRYIETINTDYLFTYKIMDAADYGAAQRRKRLLVWGCRRDQEWIDPLETLPKIPAKTIGEVIPENVSRYWDMYKPDTKYIMPVERIDGKLRKGPFSLLATPERRNKRTLTRNDVSFTLVKFSTHNMLYQREERRRFFSIEELKLIMGFPIDYKFPNKNVQEVSRCIASGIDIRFATHLLKHIKGVLE